MKPALPESIAIGRRLRVLRTNARLTYAQLAKRAGLSEPTIRNLEDARGKGVPSLRTCLRLVGALECDLWSLLSVVDRVEFRRAG
jgi:transcriptional regulator with XRE-family HTH domain